MKFKDKDGNVFENIRDALDAFCPAPDGSHEDCEKCLFQCSELTCAEFSDAFPMEAAHLMGYEVVEDELENEGNTQKQIKDWTLGEVKDWCYQYRRRHNNVQYCEESGCLLRERGLCNKDWVHEWDLSEKPCFTDEEIAAMKVLGQALLADGFKRNMHGDIFTTTSNAASVLLDSRMFPSILPGQSVKLSNILSEYEP